MDFLRKLPKKNKTAQSKKWVTGIEIRHRSTANVVYKYTALRKFDEKNLDERKEYEEIVSRIVRELNSLKDEDFITIETLSVRKKDIDSIFVLDYYEG